MFLDPAQHDVVKILESHYAEIKEELQALEILNHRFLQPYPQKDIYDRGWELFGLHIFGQRLDLCCRVCPKTAAIVETVPRMVGAAFSILRAGSHISPHLDPMGYSEFIYRCHLPLIVPPDCDFTVSGETRPWVEGQCLIFNGASLHSARNDGPYDRVCLIVDVKMNDEPLLMHYFDPKDYFKEEFE